MGFLPKCDCVSTTIWMHHLGANRMHEEKDGNNTRMLHDVFNKSWKQ